MKRLLTTACVLLALGNGSIAQAAENPRASQPLEQASQIGGRSTLIYILIAVLLSGAVSIGDIFGDDDEPDSP